MLDDPIWINDEETPVIEQEFRESKSHSKTKHKKPDELFQQGGYSCQSRD